jgi:hypothetical protein
VRRSSALPNIEQQVEIEVRVELPNKQSQNRFWVIEFRGSKVEALEVEPKVEPLGGPLAAGRLTP